MWKLNISAGSIMERADLEIEQLRRSDSSHESDPAINER